MKYIKFGYGRGTDHVCKDIRGGYITRDQGIELVRKYETANRIATEKDKIKVAKEKKEARAAAKKVRVKAARREEMKLARVKAKAKVKRELRKLHGKKKGRK